MGAAFIHYLDGSLIAALHLAVVPAVGGIGEVPGKAIDQHLQFVPIRTIVFGRRGSGTAQVRVRGLLRRRGCGRSRGRSGRRGDRGRGGGGAACGEWGRGGGGWKEAKEKERYVDITPRYVCCFLCSTESDLICVDLPAAGAARAAGVAGVAGVAGGAPPVYRE